MSTNESQTPPARKLTPLWVISLFVSLTEAFLSIAVTQTSGTIQLALTIFVIVFPLLTAIGFFAVLWYKPLHFYAPTEYGKKLSPRELAEVFAPKRNLDESKLYEDIQSTIRSTLTSKEIISKLSETVAKGAGKKIEEQVASVLISAADKTVEKIGTSNFLTIDSTQLLNQNGKIWRVPYEQFATIDDLLDDIWFSLTPYIPSYTYGEKWVLYNKKTGTVLKDIGYRWAAAHSEHRDNRSLQEVGITPGTRLEIIFPHRKETIGVNLQIKSTHGDAEELDNLARNLLYELRELDIEFAELSTSKDMGIIGAKGEARIDVGSLTLVVKLTSFMAVLVIIQNWLTRKADDELQIKLHIDESFVTIINSKVSSSELTRLAKEVEKLSAKRKS